MKKENFNKNPTVYALFAGAGGLHLGIEKAGFKVILATDKEKTAEATHKRNWPKIPFLCKDIQKVTSDELLNLAGGVKPDLIIGGPPCQGFSTIGDKLSSDPRNQLFQTYARLVADLKPQCVLIENVKAITTMYEGKFRDNIIETFSALGYKMYEKVLNAADYGVPQTRQRVFFIGTKIKNSFKFPTPTHGADTGKSYETVGKAICDLVSKSNKIPNHISLNHSDIVKRRYKYIPEGGKLPKPEELPLDIRRKNFGNTYKRLDRNKPSLTMVPGNNAFPIHPTLHRSLTPREAARIQTFPDHFVFEGDRRRQCILVGNAVPPLLAKHMGEAIFKHMQGKISSKDADSPVKVKSKLIKTPQHENFKNGFIDLFSGAGGFSIGLEKADWTPLLATDWDENVEKTHLHNNPHIPFIRGDLSDKNIQSQIINKFKNKQIGLIVGGPPCQGFSIFGKRRFINTKGFDPSLDQRNKLVFSFLNVVKKIKPNWFLMENVPGLASLEQGQVLEKLILGFKKAGYLNVEARVLNAADYGVPQKRKRLVIIGNRSGFLIPWPKKKFFELPKDWQDGYRTVGEVLTDLASKKSHEVYTCHVAMRHKPLLVERYKLIPEGEKLDVENLPKKLVKGYRTNQVRNYSHIYKRLHRDQAASTMVAGHNAFPIHPWLNRSLTVREAARIQTFPDAIEFKGNRQNQCIQVGNAFPPLLAEVIGNNLMKAEVNEWYPDKIKKSAFYSLIDRADSAVKDLISI